MINESLSYAHVLCREMRALRVQVGLTQKDMSLQLGLSIPTVNRWEQGRELPNFTRVVQACIAVYGVDPGGLLIRVLRSCVPDPRVDELGITVAHPLLRAALAHHFGMPSKECRG